MTDSEQSLEPETNEKYTSHIEPSTELICFDVSNDTSELLHETVKINNQFNKSLVCSNEETCKTEGKYVSTPELAEEGLCLSYINETDESSCKNIKNVQQVKYSQVEITYDDKDVGITKANDATEILSYIADDKSKNASKKREAIHEHSNTNQKITEHQLSCPKNLAKDEVPELNIKKQVDFVTEKSTKKRILKSSKEDGHDKKLLSEVLDFELRETIRLEIPLKEASNFSLIDHLEENLESGETEMLCEVFKNFQNKDKNTNLKDDYDYEDEWIDDSLEFEEKYTKSVRHRGFFVKLYGETEDDNLFCAEGNMNRERSSDDEDFQKVSTKRKHSSKISKKPLPLKFTTIIKKKKKIANQDHESTLRESLKAKKQRIKRKIKTDEIDAIPLVDLLRVGNLDLNSGISAFSGGQATNKQKKILKIIKKFPLENSEKEKISVSNLLIRVNKTEILDNNNSNNNDNNYSKMNNIQKKNNKICSSFIDNKYINETTTNTTDNNEKNNNNNNNSNNNKDDNDNNANVNEAQYKEAAPTAERLAKLDNFPFELRNALLLVMEKCLSLPEAKKNVFPSSLVPFTFNSLQLAEKFGQQYVSSAVSLLAELIGVTRLTIKRKNAFYKNEKLLLEVLKEFECRLQEFKGVSLAEILTNEEVTEYLNKIVNLKIELFKYKKTKNRYISATQFFEKSVLPIFRRSSFNVTMESLLKLNSFSLKDKESNNNDDNNTNNNYKNNSNINNNNSNNDNNENNNDNCNDNNNNKS